MRILPIFSGILGTIKYSLPMKLSTELIFKFEEKNPDKSISSDGQSRMGERLVTFTPGF